MTDFRALCQELASLIQTYPPTNTAYWAGRKSGILQRARAALDEPKMEGPTEDQLDVVVIAIQSLTPHPSNTDSHNLEAVDRGRRILQRAITRWGRPAAPAPKPIPVSERPWERDGWRDTEGRCWFCYACSIGRWKYQLPPDPEQDWGVLGTEAHCLPHWAIARPRPEAKEPT
jgi:hypothetical protein